MARPHHEAVRLASDPATPLAVLHELAMGNPEVHPLLAENPSTYSDLLTWLSGRGNADVNAALARRAINSAEASPASIPNEDLPTSAMPSIDGDSSSDGTSTPSTGSAPDSGGPTPAISSPSSASPTHGPGPARQSIFGARSQTNLSYTYAQHLALKKPARQASAPQSTTQTVTRTSVRPIAAAPAQQSAEPAVQSPAVAELQTATQPPASLSGAATESSVAVVTQPAAHALKQPVAWKSVEESPAVTPITWKPVGATPASASAADQPRRADTRRRNQRAKNTRLWLVFALVTLVAALGIAWASGAFNSDASASDEHPPHIALS